MAFANMAFQLVGEIPGLPMPLSKTQINEALGYIYDEQLWSFQFVESGWLTPGLQFRTGNQSSGTITVTAGSTSVIGDATASAAWAAYVLAGTSPPLTSYQIRVPYYSLYNIVGYSAVTNAPFGTFTLDRPWMEPSGSAQSYMVYQAYFPVPVSDFKRFLALRDTTNAAPIDYWTYGQRDLMMIDPQRTNFDLPAYAVPYEVDQRTGSSTLGYMLYELWPHPLRQLPYTIAYLRRGTLLSAPTDTVPYPLTEELVKWRSKEVACLWKEGQKGDGLKRGQGADWQFLAQAAAREYARCKKIIADRDRDMVDKYFTRFTRYAAIGANGEPFASIGSLLNVGRF